MGKRLVVWVGFASWASCGGMAAAYAARVKPAKRLAPFVGRNQMVRLHVVNLQRTAATVDPVVAAKIKQKTGRPGSNGRGGRDAKQVPVEPNRPLNIIIHGLAFGTVVPSTKYLTACTGHSAEVAHVSCTRVNKHCRYPSTVHTVRISSPRAARGLTAFE